MKTRQEKESEIEQLKRDFLEAPNAVLVGFQGINVANDERMRRELRASSLTYRVVKNTLAVRAAEGTPIEPLRKNFVGPTAVALSKTDPVSLAKVLSKWAKESPFFVVKAGVVEGRVIDVKDIEALSNMPSREELLSRIMFLVNSGAQRLAVATAGVARNLAVVIGQVRDQKESAGA